MANKMSVEKAQQIAADIAAARKKWGRHAAINVSEDQLYEAVTVLVEAGNFDAPSAAEVTKLRRQLAACRNRELARKPEGGTALERDEEVT